MFYKGWEYCLDAVKSHQNKSNIWNVVSHCALNGRMCALKFELKIGYVQIYVIVKTHNFML